MEEVYSPNLAGIGYNELIVGKAPEDAPNGLRVYAHRGLGGFYCPPHWVVRDLPDKMSVCFRKEAGAHFSLCAAKYQ